MKEKPVPNCVSFVYNQLGINTEDKYIAPPTLQETLRRFNRVDSIEKADVLAVVAFSERKPYLAHIAIVCSDKKTILHRRIGEDPAVEDVKTGLADFLDSNLDMRKVYYFVLKPQKVKRNLFF